MCRDEDALAGADGGRDALVPVRQEAGSGVGETCGPRCLCGEQVGVARVVPWMARVVEVERRWLHIVAASPQMGLLGAVLRRGLRLVQTLQRAVVTLVQAPAALHRNPHEIHAVQHEPEGADGALEHRSEGQIERVSLLAQHLGRRLRLRPPLVVEIDVGPAGEPVLPIPRALTVAQQDERFHRGLPSLAQGMTGRTCASESPRFAVSGAGRRGCTVSGACHTSWKKTRGSKCPEAPRATSLARPRPSRRSRHAGGMPSPRMGRSKVLSKCSTRPVSCRSSAGGVQPSTARSKAPARNAVVYVAGGRLSNSASRDSCASCTCKRSPSFTRTGSAAGTRILTGCLGGDFDSCPAGGVARSVVACGESPKAGPPSPASPARTNTAASKVAATRRRNAASANTALPGCRRANARRRAGTRTRTAPGGGDAAGSSLRKSAASRGRAASRGMPVKLTALRKGRPSWCCSKAAQRKVSATALTRRKGPVPRAAAPWPRAMAASGKANRAARSGTGVSKCSSSSVPERT